MDESDVFFDMGLSPSQEEKLCNAVMSSPDTVFGSGLGLRNEDLIHLDEFVINEDTKPIGLGMLAQSEQQLPQQFYQKPVLQTSRAATCTLPSTESYPGEYEFGIELPGLNSGLTGKSWLYSPKLNKIFINADKILPIRFTLKRYVVGLQVRALLVYMSPQDFQESVRRCPVHTEPRYYKSKRVFTGSELVPHVLRAEHEEAIYEHDEVSDRFSVVVPLGRPQPGDDTVTALYTMQCKNSCSPGMNRRITQIVFTLEDDCCNVLGRQTIPIRICSCPKRDMDKEELVKDPEDNTTSRPTKRASSHVESNIKCKRPNVDTPANIVMVPVLEKESLIAVLAVCLGYLTKAKLEGRELTPVEASLEEEYHKMLQNCEATQ